MERKRVVITGMGVLSPLGNSIGENWEHSAKGISGIDYITLFDSSDIPVHIAGEVKNFDAEALFGRRDARRTDRVTQFALEISRQAMEQSGFEVTDENRYDIGCCIGSGIGGINSLIDTIESFQSRGYRGVSPLAVPKILIDSSSGKVSQNFGLRGPNFNITTACATGNNCIGESAEIIRRGQAKLMLAGSVEAANVPVTISGFHNMTALSTKWNDDPKSASRPFDMDRDGFVQSEGAGIVMLEELEHAKARGATIYGEVIGYGHTSDAYHPTAPLDTGDGAAMAMKQAMENAQISIKDIDYINAHGTSTPLNDKSETLALKKALGEKAYEIPISSTKSITGHMLGAAGSVEAILALGAIHNNFIPPTINYETPDPDCDLNYTPNVGQEREVNIVMSNAFGFGGHNAVIILSQYDGK